MGNFVPAMGFLPLSLERPDALDTSTTSDLPALATSAFSIPDVVIRKPTISIPSGIATAPATVTVPVTFLAPTKISSVSLKPVEVRVPERLGEVGLLFLVVSPGAQVNLPTPANKTISPVMTDLRSSLELTQVGLYRIEADYGDLVVRANIRTEVKEASVERLTDDQNHRRFLLSAPIDMEIPIRLYTREPASAEHPCSKFDVCFQFLSVLPTVQLRASTPLRFDLAASDVCIVFVGLGDAPRCPR